LLNVAQNLTNFITAEHDRKFLFTPGADKQQCWPGALEGIFIEEFDAAKGYSAGAAASFFNVFAVKEIISQILFGDLTGSFVEMFAQLANGSGIKGLRAIAVAFEL